MICNRPMHALGITALLLFALTSLQYTLHRTGTDSDNASSFSGLSPGSSLGMVSLLHPSKTKEGTEFVRPLDPGLDMQAETLPPPPSDPDKLEPPRPGPFAYVFYVTEEEHSCAALINIDRLQRRHRTENRIFVIATPRLSAFYVKAFEERFVTISIHDPPILPGGGVHHRPDSILKLFAFKMHHIEPELRRVLIMDSDQLILKPLDDLFRNLPEIDLAAPRAYWIAKDRLTSAFMMINLSDRLWNTMLDAYTKIKAEENDMDVINDALGETALLLPGSYSTPNSHWETWTVPKWFRPEEDMSNIAVEKTNYPDFRGAQFLKDVPPGADSRRRPRRHQESKSKPATPVLRERELEGLPPSGNELDDAAIAKPPVPPSNSKSEEARPASKTHEKNTTDMAQDKPGPDNAPAPETDSSDKKTSDNHSEEVPIAGAFTHKTKEEHPRFETLNKVYDNTAVLHFSALGKPWSYPVAAVEQQRPNAHPLFYQQFREWREEAKRVCHDPELGS